MDESIKGTEEAVQYFSKKLKLGGEVSVAYDRINDVVKEIVTLSDTGTDLITPETKSRFPDLNNTEEYQEYYLALRELLISLPGETGQMMLEYEGYMEEYAALQSQHMDTTRKLGELPSPPPRECFPEGETDDEYLQKANMLVEAFIVHTFSMFDNLRVVLTHEDSWSDHSVMMMDDVENLN